MIELDLEKIAERVTAMRKKLPKEGNDWQWIPKGESYFETREGSFEFNGIYKYDIRAFYTRETEIITLDISPYNFSINISISRVCPPWGERRVDRKIHGGYMGRPPESEQHEGYQPTGHTAEIVDRLLELTERTIDAYLS